MKKKKHVIAPSSFLCRFMDCMDFYAHRVNIIHLIKGYYPKYSMTVALAFFLVSLTFTWPSEKQLVYSSLTSFIALSFLFIMIAAGLFRLSGGTFKRRRNQEEWLMENIQDILQLLYGNISLQHCLYSLFILEVIAQFGKVLQGPVCMCIMAVVWLAWLVWREGKRMCLTNAMGVSGVKKVPQGVCSKHDSVSVFTA
ncbi:hypothetical protein LSM04_005213 [Trypanosoma melophagium]|uniref:uncharacterized protein n=1 Tax=Trypanosoma melophagium TaxID=715481 RepID=UPI00351A06DA|nr:hypothetical protein LSM04_005213 [Trypanosoma melophagium]